MVPGSTPAKSTTGATACQKARIKALERAVECQGPPVIHTTAIRQVVNIMQGKPYFIQPIKHKQQSIKVCVLHTVLSRQHNFFHGVDRFRS